MNIKEAPVIVLKDVVSLDTLNLLQQYCHEQNDKSQSWCTEFNRKFVHNPNNDIIKKLHLDFIPQVSRLVGLNMKPSYTFMSLYGKNGYCPPHFDRPQCQYTLDLQVNSDGVWPLFVKSDSYVLEDNHAMCYSGTYHFHYRRKMPDNMSFCHLIFFHYVPQSFEGSLD